MTRLVALSLLAFAITACSGDATPVADRASPVPASTTARPSPPPPPPALPAVDAGLGDAAAPLRYLTCDAEIAMLCPDGYEWGCQGDWTTVHACVRKELPAQVPCDRQIMMTCRDGETNSCALTPPMGAYHVCVLVDRSTAAP